MKEKQAAPDEIPRSISSQPQNNLSPTTDYQKQLKFIGIKENDIKFRDDKQLKEKGDIENVIRKLGSNIAIADCKRLGRFTENKNRPLLVTFASIWDKRLCHTLAIQKKLFNSDGVLIVPELSPEDRLIEKRLLQKRYDMIHVDKVAPERLKIRKLKLLLDNIEVTID